MVTCSAIAQDIKVTGTVTDAETGEPIIGATVVLEGSGNAYSITNESGNYSLNAPANGNLNVSFLGYISTVVSVNGKSKINITLEPDSQLLQEVVVTAMGISRREKTIGYSATTVKNADLTVLHSSNVSEALAGKVAGVSVQTTSTDPGSATSVVIRGFSSINGSNQPLYVVDGVPIQNITTTGYGHATSAAGISDIPAENIESMTILKGAAATALYGSRAANGVIIVTTKTGKKGDIRDFTIDYSGGIQLRQVSVLPTYQNDYGQGWNGTQTFIENGSWGPKLDGSTQVYGPIWNHQQRIHTYSAVESNVKDFFDLGFSHNHNIAFSGASSDNKLNYYMSYGYTGDDGVMPGNKDTYTKNAFNLRASYQAAKWLKVGGSFNFAKSSTNTVGSFQGTSVIDGVLEFPRDMSIVDLKDLSVAFNTPEAYLTPYGITNPYWSLENNYNHQDSKHFFGNMEVTATPVKNLNFIYRFGFDYNDYDRKIGEPKIALDDALIDEDYGYAPSNMNQDGSVYASYRRGQEINHDFLVTYNNTWGKWSLDATVGTNINERSSTSMTGQTDVLTFESGFWDLSNGSTKTTIAESQSKRRLIGLFGQVSVGFADQLFLELNARNDWSSTLPIENNNYFYPGATLSWVFTNLMKQKDVLSFGKLRASYGKTGNDAGVYLTNPSYVQASSRGYYGTGIVKFPFASMNSFVSSTTAGSSTLRPEMTSEFEVGADLKFFNKRIGIDAAYYDRKTDDQIFTLPVDPATGYSSMVTNFGTVRNRGYELLLTTIPVRTKNVIWTLDFNFAQNFNKVITMPESLEGGKVNIYSFSAGNDAVYMYAEEGKPMGEFYTYRPKTVTDINSPYYGCPIVDEKGQPVLDTEVTDTGKNMNSLWTGGISTSLTVYGFTLSATLDVRYGGYMFSRTKNLMQFTGSSPITTYNDRRPFIIPNSVQETENGYVENTAMIYMSNSSYQNWLNSYGAGEGGEFYLMDRTFAKLRNVSLTWNLPKKWMDTIKFRGMALTLFCNNAFVWTPSSNVYIDPEATTTGTDLAGNFGELYSNPAQRVWGLNLNIKF